MHRWQLQDAKARLSELLRGVTDGPQEITLHGKSAAVVLSKADYDRLRRKEPSLVRFLRRSPLAGVELDIERDKSPARSGRL